jgi:hypothetical protein
MSEIPPDAWANEIRKKERPGKGVVWDTFEVVEPTTRCKHDRQNREDCCTSSLRDALHRTAGGKGRIGRLRRRR